ncbi:MAG TPA: magnesium chelatase, partial [Desulfurococcaceae archaeon]|nr:magnesium chelatase [Desulfurococcaceae archaeon]
LLPSDIIGVKVYNYKAMEFEFRPGPVFTNILLADEINRTPPRTQAALLEAMQEKQVTVDGETYKLPEPFVVIATQNPVETEGTYPLPEAQLDRFLFRVIVDYPSRNEEVEMLRIKRVKGEVIDVDQVAGPKEVLEASKTVAEKVKVDDTILEYIVDLVRATREHPSVLLGGSPRAEVMLLYASRAYAAISEGRDYVVPDDVKAVFFDVMNHRIILRPEYVIGTYSREPLWSYRAIHGILSSVVEKVRVPK